jgi:hypothetical protein
MALKLDADEFTASRFWMVTTEAVNKVDEILTPNELYPMLSVPEEFIEEVLTPL